MLTILPSNISYIPFNLMQSKDLILQSAPMFDTILFSYISRQELYSSIRKLKIIPQQQPRISTRYFWQKYK